MTTQIEIEGELTVIRAHELKERCLAALQTGAHLAVDLSGTTELDGAGLQLLVALRREAEERGGGIELLNPSPQAKAVLALARLDAGLHPTQHPSEDCA